MSIRSFFLAVALLAAFAVISGCQNRGRSGGPGGRDSGIIIGGSDSGTPPGTDGGPGVDSGRPPGTDSGPPPGRDSGPPPRDAGFCPADILESAVGPYCSATTRTCIDGCASGGSDTCVGDCIDADPGPDCGACINNNVIVCANRMGCQRSWDLFMCCVNDHSCTDRTCAVTYCMPEDDALNECIGGITGSCASEVNDCFG